MKSSSPKSWHKSKCRLRWTTAPGSDALRHSGRLTSFHPPMCTAWWVLSVKREPRATNKLGNLFNSVDKPETQKQDDQEDTKRSGSHQPQNKHPFAYSKTPHPHISLKVGVSVPPVSLPHEARQRAVVPGKRASEKDVDRHRVHRCTRHNAHHQRLPAPLWRL